MAAQDQGGSNAEVPTAQALPRRSGVGVALCADDRMAGDQLLGLRERGEVDGPLAGLRALHGLDARLPGHHRLDAVRAHLHERAGAPATAADYYARAAAHATNTAERDHLIKQLAKLNPNP